MLKRQPSAIRYLLTAAFILSLFVIPYLFKKNRTVTVTRMLMGTIVEITVPEDSEASVEPAFSEIKRLEDIFSSYKKNSDPSGINASAGSLVKVNPETIDVLKAAKYVAGLSDGAFDPTVGVFAGLWGFSGERGEVPTEEKIKKLLLLVDFKEITIDEQNGLAGLNKKGMAINLGGLAKGYIVGKAGAALKKNGVKKAIIKAGGDMFVFNDHDKKPFKIGIRHPRKDSLLAELDVLNGSVATSGDYERFFIKGGKRFHHVLNPKTGYPSEGVLSATVIAKDPARADALSTAVFVLGRVMGMRLIEQLPDVEGVIVDSNERVFRSSGLAGRILP